MADLKTSSVGIATTWNPWAKEAQDPRAQLPKEWLAAEPMLQKCGLQMEFGAAQLAYAQGRFDHAGRAARTVSDLLEAWSRAPGARDLPANSAATVTALRQLAQEAFARAKQEGNVNRHPELTPPAGWVRELERIAQVHIDTGHPGAASSAYFQAYLWTGDVKYDNLTMDLLRHHSQQPAPAQAEKTTGLAYGGTRQDGTAHQPLPSSSPVWMAASAAAPARTTPPAAAAHPGPTVLDVVHDPQLVLKHSLFFEQLAHITSEEIVAYIGNIIAAMERPSTGQELRCGATNLTFAFQELDHRTEKGWDYLHAASQVATAHFHDTDRPDPSPAQLPAADAQKLREAVERFGREEGLVATSVGAEAATFAGARELGRIRGSLFGLETELTRAQSVPYDEPDFQKKLKNSVPKLVDLVDGLTAPTDPAAAAVFARTARELIDSAKRVQQYADGAGNKAIAKSCPALVAALEKLIR